MFEALTKGFREAQNRLAGLTELNQKNVQAALKEVRLSLLEADVELGVVKRFLGTVEEKALGQTVQTRVRHGGETHKVSAGDQKEMILSCPSESAGISTSVMEPAPQFD